MPTEKNDQNCVLQFIIITNADELFAARLLVDCSQLRSFSVLEKANKKTMKVKYNILGPWIVSLCVCVCAHAIDKANIDMAQENGEGKFNRHYIFELEKCLCNLIRLCTSFAFAPQQLHHSNIGGVPRT